MKIRGWWVTAVGLAILAGCGGQKPAEQPGTSGAAVEYLERDPEQATVTVAETPEPAQPPVDPTPEVYRAPAQPTPPPIHERIQVSDEAVDAIRAPLEAIEQAESVEAAETKIAELQAASDKLRETINNAAQLNDGEKAMLTDSLDEIHSLLETAKQAHGTDGFENAVRKAQSYFITIETQVLGKVIPGSAPAEEASNEAP